MAVDNDGTQELVADDEGRRPAGGKQRQHLEFNRQYNF
jgi:hypothetical protein